MVYIDLPPQLDVNVCIVTLTGIFFFFFFFKRVITGLGVGGFTATIPIFIAETTPAENRGKLVLLEGFFAIGGVALASWIEFGLYYVENNPVSWRFPIAFQAVFALVITSLILFMPESPRWLIYKDRVDQATSVLGRLEGTPKGQEQSSESVVMEVHTIQHTLRQNQVAGGSTNPFAFNDTRNFHRTCLAVVVNMLAQMSGVNIVTFYSDTIFENDLNFSGNTSRIITGCLQIWQFLCAGLAVLLIDRFGRRPLLIGAVVGMTISQAGLAGLNSDLTNRSAAGATILFDFIVFICFPVGLFIVPFMYAAEIAPLQTRAKVTAMAAAANWLFNFLIAEVTPIGFDTIKWRYYLVYVCINFAAGLIFYFLFPETRGRSLEEIDEIFIQSKNIFDTVRVARDMPPHLDVIATIEDEEKATNQFEEEVK